MGGLVTSGYLVPISTSSIDLPINLPVNERSLDSEIIRLSKQYAVNEKTVRKIIQCESRMYPKAVNENKDKNGITWSKDWGPMQINDYYHNTEMSKLNLDIHDEYDSLEYGIKLLATQGTKPWTASEKCWSKI